MVNGKKGKLRAIHAYFQVKSEKQNHYSDYKFKKFQ